MNFYKNGKIYKITCLKTGLIYIGSTTKMHLEHRLVRHVEDFQRWKYFGGGYMTSFKIIENEDFQIELVEDCSCNTKEELLRREQHFIKTLVCVNKVIPLQTRAEYRVSNQDKIKAYALQKWFCACCKVDVGISKRRRHERSKKHLDRF
jgi:predicted GIY-YIG superfamily endonuclease